MKLKTAAVFAQKGKLRIMWQRSSLQAGCREGPRGGLGWGVEKRVTMEQETLGVGKGVGRGTGV